MSSGSIMIIFTTGFFILLGCGMLAILLFGIRAIINSNDRRADTIARGYASGQIVEAPHQVLFREDKFSGEVSISFDASFGLEEIRILLRVRPCPEI